MSHNSTSHNYLSNPVWSQFRFCLGEFHVLATASCAGGQTYKQPRKLLRELDAPRDRGSNDRNPGNWDIVAKTEQHYRRRVPHSFAGTLWLSIDRDTDAAGHKSQAATINLLLLAWLRIKRYRLLS